MAKKRSWYTEVERARVPVGNRPHVFVELRSSQEGCYAKARIEGASAGLPRAFVGVYGTREKAISETTSWAVGWIRKLRGDPPAIVSQGSR
jgi:hypothetical protein